MSRTYRPVSAHAKALHGGDPFDAEFTPSEERDEVDGGHLEIVPGSYRVRVDNYVAGKQGESVELALLIELESALLAGGVLERPEPSKKNTTTTKKRG